MNLKELFDSAENGTLTWEQFEAAAKDKNAKFVDLSEGNYVSKSKYDADIKQLNTTISTRDSDLEGLKQQIAKAGDDATKVSELSQSISDLQSKYDADVKNYKAQLKKQAYEFAVKDLANGQKFTSKAAKRDFINSLLSKELKMEGSKILGADDFISSYSSDNADAFLKEEEPKPTPTSNSKPMFVASTEGGAMPVDETGGFANAFHFTEIHPNKK